AVIPLSEVVKHAGDRLVLGCKSGIRTTCYADYGEEDDYCLLNAVPTAEAALKIAIENTDFTLWKSRVLVIGYGRVGKILADRLKAMGCDVTVSARKAADFALAEALGFRSIPTESIAHSDLDYDLVFNTVDHRVIDSPTLQKSRATLFIDLASQNGFDPEEVRKCGKIAIKAPGLPGKTAPKTAGKILAQTVVTLINRHYAENQ
ncbi:MAG: hypothetical protein IJT66_02465, partial [Clostridia bacterium]|nr:hypothetical protein [Clostridia bacterium]